MLIRKIAELLTREKAIEIQHKVQKRRKNGDYRPFAEILQEEIDKIKQKG